MEPLFTNDAIVLGLLLMLLAAIFHTASVDHPRWKNFYRYVPPLLLCYFLPALLYWPLGLIAPEWYDNSLLDYLQSLGISVSEGASIGDVHRILQQNGIDPESPEIKEFYRKSQLYFVASRYLLPASLVLLCLGIDIQGIINLGPKAIIMFLTATAGIVLGGPIALLVILNLTPGIIPVSLDEVWRGLSTVAGSWIGGGANQTAMKEIYDVENNLFGTMIIVDVVVANIWMGFLLYGASITERLDKWLKADVSAIEDLKRRVAEYRAKIAQTPTLATTFVVLGIAFGGVAFSHLGSDIMTPWMTSFKETLDSLRLNSLMSGFFWLIVFSTTIGFALSFTSLRKLEGVGASRFGSVFIYILVATIGMKMNLGEVVKNLGLFSIGLVWMAVHVLLLLVVAKLIRAPFFFVAVGSQANVGGAASAPIVASAFSSSLAPVGVLLAVLGYALGTYMAIVCAEIMHVVSVG